MSLYALKNNDINCKERWNQCPDLTELFQKNLIKTVPGQQI